MEINVDFFKIENKVVPRQGSILISEPFSQDTYFGRSVVLLTEHNDKGSFGFVLNKPIEMSLTDAIEGVSDFEAPISMGGPVNTDSVFFIHTLGDAVPNSIPIAENIYWGGNFDILQLLINSGSVKSNQVRFFVGYSGWHAKQLDSEIDRNNWIVSDIQINDIMTSNNKDIWKTTLNRLGQRYKTWINFPANPIFN